MKSHVSRALARAEHETEQLLAYLRAVVFLVITAVFWASGALEQDHMAMFSVAGLGALALGSLTLAWSGFFRPWLPWGLATLDVSLLLHCVAMFTIGMGMPFHTILGAPGASLIFLFLAIAAVRHRPFLVLYTGALFFVGWLGLWLITDPGSTLSSAADAGLAGELARLAVIALTATILFIAVRRTRRALTDSIRETRLRTNLARFFSPGMADELARSEYVARSFRPQKAAVMFVDIRGFTAIAEGMEAGELAAFLNEYRRRMSLPVSEHGGIIDKFIGDGIMAVFGVPLPGDEDARNAVQCGLDILRAADRWNDQRRGAGLAPVKIGVGVHYGDVTAGALGDEQRLEFTVIGDTVNAANRIEELAGDLGVQLLVSADALEAAGWLGDAAAWEFLPEQTLRGRRKPIRLLALREDGMLISALANTNANLVHQKEKADRPPTTTALQDHGRYLHKVAS